MTTAEIVALIGGGLAFVTAVLNFLSQRTSERTASKWESTTNKSLSIAESSATRVADSLKVVVDALSQSFARTESTVAGIDRTTQTMQNRIDEIHKKVSK